MKFLTIFSAILLISSIKGKFVINLVNDVHLDLRYDPYADIPSFCQYGGKRDPTYAPYGRHGCDAPYLLFKSALKEMAKISPRPDLVLVPGDLVTHMLPSESNDFDRKNYKAIKDVIQNYTRETASVFPGIPILFTQGNDDYAINYQVPNQTYKVDYYSFVFQKTIKEIAANNISVIYMIIC